MANPASALGEAVGRLIEAEVQRIIRETVEPLGFFVDTGGPRPGKRRGTKVMLLNDTGNQYQIDTVVEDKHGNPVALVECKYIRYKKHNRDKASWTCVAHYKLRTTNPTIRKSIAVLIGDWTAPSKKLMKSFGVEIIEIPFARLARVLAGHGVQFRWAEDDSDVPTKSLAVFRRLSQATKRQIASQCLKHAEPALGKLISEAVRLKEKEPKNVTQVELLLKTNRDEYYLRKFSELTDAIGYLVKLTGQRPDLREILK